MHTNFPSLKLVLIVSEFVLVGVGCAVGAVVVIILVIVLCVCLRRRRTKMENASGGRKASRDNAYVSVCICRTLQELKY